MSNFDNNESIPPTRLLRNKPTEKIDAGSVPPSTQKVSPPPPLQNDEINNEFRQESSLLGDNIMSGGNFAESPITPPPPPQQQVPPASNSPKTVLFRPNSGGSVAGSAVAPAPAQNDRPITAWLVVVKGNGTGTALAVSYGLHRIGRDADQDVPLAFGDESVSRQEHAFLEYDPKTRQFYLSKGSNLVYLNGERVGQGCEREIVTGDEIELGENTVLRFVSFCGKEFDWHDVKA